MIFQPIPEDGIVTEEWLTLTTNELQRRINLATESTTNVDSTVNQAKVREFPLGCQGKRHGIRGIVPAAPKWKVPLF